MRLIKLFLKKIWWQFNSEFGSRNYFRKDGILYVKEGFNKPEPFWQHLKEYHPEEYERVKNDIKD